MFCVSRTPSPGAGPQTDFHAIQRYEGLFPRLAVLRRVQRQREPPQPFAHLVPEAPGVGLVLEAHDEVSGAEGSHLRALAEPYVTLSRHTAPIVRPRPKSKAQ